MSANGFTLAFDLVKAPCRDCWAHLDTLHRPVEGSGSSCSTCDNPVRTTTLDIRGDVQKGLPGVGAFDLRDNELPETSVVLGLRFAKREFPDINCIATRVNREGSAMNKITDTPVNIIEQPECQQTIVLLHKLEDFESGPARVVRLEAGVYAFPTRS